MRLHRVALRAARPYRRFGNRRCPPCRVSRLLRRVSGLCNSGIDGSVSSSAPSLRAALAGEPRCIFRIRSEGQSVFMKIAVLTSHPFGTASECLPELAQSGTCDVIAVILAPNAPTRRLRVIRRKLAKLLRIGILGAINGVRMRKWYSGPDTDHIRDLCDRLGIPALRDAIDEQ